MREFPDSEESGNSLMYKKLPLPGWHSPRPDSPEGALNSEEVRKEGVFGAKKQKK
jgi:hypothetical protein